MSKRFVPRLYLADEITASGVLQLCQEQSHYLKTVMRVMKGDVIHVFDGKNGEWSAEITEITKKLVTLEVKEQRRQQSEYAPSNLALIFAPVKQIEQQIRQATELGVDEFIPVQTQFTSAFMKHVRCQSILQGAAEQSERLNMPKLAEIQPLDDVLNQTDRTIIFCDESRDADSIIAAAAKKNPSTSYAILIGPEGGFSPEEIVSIKARDNVIPVSLGQNILKADTAATAAISAWIL